MEKTKYIPTEYLQFHPYRGLVIAFGYTDEEGKEDGNVRIGRIADWYYPHKDTSNGVSEFYIDVCLKGVEEKSELHTTFEPYRMVNIRIATKEEIKGLTDALRAIYYQKMIEDAEIAEDNYIPELEENQRWKNYIKEIETISVKYGFDARDLWCYLNDKAAEEGW
jgi:hypothetical protein